MHVRTTRPFRPAAVRAAALWVVLAVAVAVVPASSALAAPAVVRLAGADRYATAVAVAQEGWPSGAGTVYLAAGDRFPEALAAGPAAAAEGAPILLTEPDRLPAVVRTELARLGPAELVVLGGTGAVSTAVIEDAASATGAAVRRVAGLDRHETAARLAQRVWEDGAATVFLASSAGFADALAAGPVAAASGSPLLLTPSTQLADTTARALQDLRADEVVVVGGSNAISEQVAATAGAGRRVRRVAGSDRYRTALDLAEAVPATAGRYVATGTTFPDALAAAPLVAARRAALVLSTPGCVPPAVGEALATATELTLLGGERSLAAAVGQLVTCSASKVATTCPDDGERLAIVGPQLDRTRLTGLPDGFVIDARSATWHGVHDWPVHLEAGPGLCVQGGTIRGTWDDTTSWDVLHSTGALNLFAPSATVTGTRIHNYGDGIRLLNGARDATVAGAHLSYIRDDCVENDDVYGGVVRDSLLDGCYVAFSARPWQTAHDGDGSGRTWRLEGNLVRLQPMPTVYKGPAPGHGGFFKWNEQGPALSLHGNVFRADQDSNHTTMGIPEGKLADCSDNVMVWLGSGPYPAPLPDCFTVTTDRGVWDAAVADWHAAHG